jgi:hypothetical protein
MPVKTARADIFLEWRDILAAFEEHADKLALVEPIRAALAESLERATELNDLQAHYTALKQQTTQDLRQEIDLGRERARRARSAAKAVLGTDREQLTQFKVAPRRKQGPRKRRRKAAQPEAAEGAPAPTEPSEGQPEAQPPAGPRRPRNQPQPLGSSASGSTRAEDGKAP